MRESLCGYFACINLSASTVMNRLYFVFVNFFVLFQVSAQNSSSFISGSVTTNDGHTAEYIQVFVKGTGFGDVTDEKGHFGFKCSPGSCMLVVQSISCHKQELEVVVPMGDTLRMAPVKLVENKQQLGEVVVTGQFEAQSVRNSVYRVRTINSEKIESKAAVDLKSILENEPGIRFTNDLTTGESDIQLMGMSGQNVKVLIDGVPMIDRGATKQSLSQIDVNSIERIEIVEGPMSVVYGTDALAGVINIITKKSTISTRKVSVIARVQEETVGDEYEPLVGEGKHNEHVGLSYVAKKGFHAGANITRNDFGGWQGSYTGRAKQWKEKDQLLGESTVGYRNDKANVWYRLDLLDEHIVGLGNVNVLTNLATDKDYHTTRQMHQLQGSYKASQKWNWQGVLSVQNYERATETTTINLTTNDRRLAIGAGLQDVSTFGNMFGRATALWRVSDKASYQFGTEVRHDNASGDRIQGEPSIQDYSAFAAAELKFGEMLQVRPGLRFSKNSTYDAPPVIPSVNVKMMLGNDADLRLSYASGFRAPALRELYFWFFDASHSIKGNTDLKAEYSNSYTASLTYRPVHGPQTRITTTLSPFYNQFNNLITTASDPNDPSVSTYVNIDDFKTAGATFDATCHTGNWQISAGASYIGRYNKYRGMEEYAEQTDEIFEWSPEATFGLLYKHAKWDTSLGLTYKYTGEKPTHELRTVTGEPVVSKAYIGDFHWADITLTQPFGKYLKAQTGVRNLFDITELDNTSQASGGHSSSGPVPLSYGRSYFVGLLFEF
jgi:outer membrane receptor for ferrienterochelin and colicins